MKKMKKAIIIFLILTLSILGSACYTKSSNKSKAEEKVLASAINDKNINLCPYKELDKLPQKYNSELSKNNGDVVGVHGKGYNTEKLDIFIETYKNKKADVADMIRITTYTTEGDAIIKDLVVNTEGIMLIEDNTRDNFSSLEDRKKTKYKVVDIVKKESKEGISYSVKTEKGEERFLFFINSK